VFAKFSGACSGRRPLDGNLNPTATGREPTVHMDDDEDDIAD
jgi:hypothetical protein